MRYHYLFILFYLIMWSETVNAQNRNINTEPNRCGTDSLMQELLKDPVYKAGYEQRQAAFEAKLQTVKNRVGGCTDPIRLPLAVHFQEIIDPDPDCLRQLTEDQIRILNEDFQGTNADITEWTDDAAARFPGVSYGQACIEFYLATVNHPEGYGLTEGEPAITINQFDTSDNPDFAGYINIFVGPLNALGMSPVGGCGDGDGVCINRHHFGSAPDCGTVSSDSPYELGRTLTHEMGHYLNLRHIWGWQNEECEEEDRVADTPIAYDRNFGCPYAGKTSCGSLDMHMNYMDYTHDQCMYMFTAGQVARMETWLETNLENVFNNTAVHCPGCFGNLYFLHAPDRKISSGYYQSQGFILFSGYLPVGDTLVANAAKFVLLDTVFTAKYGSSFLAYIEGCDNDRILTPKTGKKTAIINIGNIEHPTEKSSDTKKGMNIKNTPNPFSQHTTFEIDLQETTKVNLKLYDAKGSSIATIINDKVMKAGQYKLHFDANDLPSGIYFYQLSTAKENITKKMFLKR